jgi:hypothetical protein
MYHLVLPLYPDEANFIFSIVLKQQQNGMKTNPTKGA